MVKLKELEAKNEPNQRRLDCKYRLRWRSCPHCPATRGNYRNSVTRKWPKHRDIADRHPSINESFPRALRRFIAFGLPMRPPGR